MKLIFASLITAGIAVANGAGIYFAAHGKWWFLVVTLVATGIAFGKIGCAAHH